MHKKPMNHVGLAKSWGIIMNTRRGATPIIRKPIVSDFPHDVGLFIWMIKEIVLCIYVRQSAGVTYFVGQKERIATD